MCNLKQSHEDVLCSTCLKQQLCIIRTSSLFFYTVFSNKYKRKFQWLLQDNQTSLFLPFLCEDDGGGVPNVEQSGEGEPHFSLPVCVLVIL